MERAPSLFLQLGTRLKWERLSFAFQMQQKLPVLLREMFKAKKMFSSNLDLFKALNDSPEGYSLLSGLEFGVSFGKSVQLFCSPLAAGI